MEILYKTSAISTGGRDGKVTVENSTLEFEMALPSELGGEKKNGANPEQLFAAGYSACFGSAMQHVLQEKNMSIQVPTINLSVGIGANDTGGFVLAVNIVAIFKGIDQVTADALIKEAHQVCPYSNATKGNIEVNLSAKIDQ
ncbi:MAG: organic hydroperoxide resistance protein [Oscillospiraceae bacterium]